MASKRPNIKVIDMYFNTNDANFNVHDSHLSEHALVGPSEASLVHSQSPVIACPIKE